jgi:hypothetical protein
MSRVITFSRVFPSYHPRKGEDTNFIRGLIISLKGKEVAALNFGFDPEKYIPKHHTIRQGNRWKVGDKFSPRVWSGKPYYSKQITIAPDIEIKKVWDIEICDWCAMPSFIEGAPPKFLTINGKICHDLELLAKNDGLSLIDLLYWFDKPFFKGQIICWNEKINY